MDIVELMQKRYSCKSFNKDKTIPEDTMKRIKELLRLAPSSTNVQPWKFIIVSTEQGKEMLAESAHDIYSFNKDKILYSSASVIFSYQKNITDEYLEHLTDKEQEDGRFAQEKFKIDNHNGRKMFVDMHKNEYKDIAHWCEKQVYINLGCFIAGVAVLGLDSIVMEGVDMNMIDEKFNLNKDGFKSCTVVSLGYHSDDDFNLTLPKSRLSPEEIIEEA